MEFVIATIPTVLGVNESSRLLHALQEEQIPTKTIVVNQIIGDHMGATYTGMKVKEQNAALQMIADSESLKDLAVLKAKTLDLEVRGIPALQYFGSLLWPSIATPAEGARRLHEDVLPPSTHTNYVLIWIL